MEQISIFLFFLSFFETLLISLMVFSLISLKPFTKKYFILVLIAAIIELIVRSFPVTPLIIIFTTLVVYIIFIKIFYNVPVLVISIAVLVSAFTYLIFELISVPILIQFMNFSYQEFVNNLLIRSTLFLFQALFISLLIYIIKKYNFTLNDLIKFFNFEDIKILADDEVDLNREQRVTTMFYLVIVFLLIQGLFINFYISSDQLLVYFHINNFFTSHLFINIFLMSLNICLFILIRHLIITLRIERDDIIERIKEKNALRLDWEKRAQMHDRNHHLSMLYIMLQVNKIERAKEYLKGMVGEIQNVDAIVKSGSQTLNALIRSKMALAKKQGVNVSLSVKTPLQGMQVRDWDLNSIIGNLLDNAIEAVEKLEGQKEVELIIDGEGGSNEFEVITYGVVIPDHIEANIFKKGYSSKEEKGHGLGLAICKELVDAYRGQIDISKDKDQEYTSFRVNIPAS
ncbi:MAG: sensor histidine kinase [bacterium]